MALTRPGALGGDWAGASERAELLSSRLAPGVGRTGGPTPRPLGPQGGLARTSPLSEADGAAGRRPDSARGTGPSLPPQLPTVGQALPGIPLVPGLSSCLSWPFSCLRPREPPTSLREELAKQPPPWRGVGSECPADPQQLVPDPGLHTAAGGSGVGTRGQMQTGRRPAPRGPPGGWELASPRGLEAQTPPWTGASASSTRA